MESPPDESRSVNDEVLTGQTAFEKPDLLADSAGRRLIPHPDRPNQPVIVDR
jgi:hypothetical protein